MARILERFLVLAVLICTAMPVAEAHESQPTRADLTIAASGAEITLTLDVEAVMSGLGQDHEQGTNSIAATRYEALRALAPADLASRIKSDRFAERVAQLSANGANLSLELIAISVPPVGDTSLPRRSTLQMRSMASLNANAITVAFAPAIGQVILQIGASEPGAEPQIKLLASGEASGPIPVAVRNSGTIIETLRVYAISGFVHILPHGLDHILFIVALFLAGATLRPLAMQVTIFTLAHSITLALSALGHVRVPAEIVEPLIAASLIFVAIENILSPRLRKWRLGLIFGFGLMHGLGFAGVMAEADLPPATTLVGLLGFNIGVEIGQIAVIAICYLLVGAWFAHRQWYRAGVVVPGSLAISIVGCFWVAERIGVLG